MAQNPIFSLLIGQNWFLLLGFVLYALFSSPTPDTIGWAEMAIGVCLVFGIGLRRMMDVAAGRFIAGSRDEQVMGLAFVTLLIIPAVIGVLTPYPANDVVRDIIPLGYLFLPLFLYHHDPVRLQRHLLSLCIIGVCYALRFWPSSGLTWGTLGQSRGNDESIYLTSSPAVMFAGLYLLLYATRIQTTPVLRRVLFLTLGFTCLLTLAAILQRGSLLLSALMIWGVFLSRAQRSLRFLLLSLAAMLLALLIAGDHIVQLVQTILQKTAEVGDNQRFAEWHSVIDRLGPDPWHWMFGAGWGTTVMTAASGHAEVRYTHMLISYIMLKAGVFGLIALIAYLAVLLKHTRRAFQNNPMLVLSAAPSLILGLTLYPTFKMLCFGAMLSLITATAKARHV